MQHKIQSKYCKVCTEVKPSSEFSYGKRICKPCRSKQEIENYWKSPETYREKKRGKPKTKAREAWQEKNRNYQYEWHLRATYGLTQEDYNTLLSSQGYKCAICGAQEQERMFVDHCHATGKVRGLLCNSCNCGLGFFQDNVQYMRNAIEYIEKHDIT